MDKILYLRHKSGATHEYKGRRCAKLFKEIRAGRGGVETTALVENGYTGFLGQDGNDWDFEGLSQYLDKSPNMV